MGALAGTLTGGLTRQVISLFSSDEVYDEGRIAVVVARHHPAHVLWSIAAARRRLAAHPGLPAWLAFCGELSEVLAADRQRAA